MKRVQGIKPFWKGWKQGFRYVAKGEGTLWDHLYVLFCLPLYPILWPACYVYLLVKEYKDDKN